MKLQCLGLKSPDPDGKALTAFCREDDNVDFLWLVPNESGHLVSELAPALCSWSHCLHALHAHGDKTIFASLPRLLHKLALLNNSVASLEAGTPLGKHHFTT